MKSMDRDLDPMLPNSHLLLKLIDMYLAHRHAADVHKHIRLVDRKENSIPGTTGSDGKTSGYI